MARRPFQSGRSTVTRRSKRPGRKSALSSPSGRFVAAIDADPTLTTYSINFIEEDDAGRGFLGLIEEITHAAGANTDQHLDKLRTAHREEGHSRLACHGTRQQGLSGSRRAYQQHPTGNLATQPLELVWGLQKFNHLNQIVFRFINTRHISKGGTRSIS